MARRPLPVLRNALGAILREGGLDGTPRTWCTRTRCCYSLNKSHLGVARAGLRHSRILIPDCQRTLDSRGVSHAFHDLATRGSEDDRKTRAIA
jgi:hypothetical protein